jgi:protein-tyrosine phosphatase
LFDERNEKADYLKDVLVDNNIDIDLKLGFEILCDDDIFNVKYFKPYTLCDSRYILIEFDFFKPTIEDVEAWLKYLLSFDLIPIIAHPERYEFVKKDISVIERLSEKGCLFQLNSGSVVGVFGEYEASVALKMLLCGYADFLGSDAHDLRWRNTDMYVFLRDYPEAVSDEVLEKILFENPQRVVNNEPIKPKRLKSLLDL